MQGKKVCRTKIEYGGFLPLELNSGKEYFSDYESYLMRFNTFKSAFKSLIEKIEVREIYLPYYYCPTTIEAIKNIGLDVFFYHIDEKLRPIDVPDRKNSLIIIVDYFGVCNTSIIDFIGNYSNAELVIDRAHNFFVEPILNRNVHNIYVAKKFFGIPDGAYLISQSILPSIEVQAMSYQYAGYLLKAYELGTNAAYIDKKKADELLAESSSNMSLLSMGLLKNVDYEMVKNSRENNYASLHKVLKTINNMTIPQKTAAYQYPLLIKNEGKKIKKTLIENKVYVSTLWEGTDLLNDGSDFELSLMNDGIFLPIDQRYDGEDMKYIISLIETIRG